MKGFQLENQFSSLSTSTKEATNIAPKWEMDNQATRCHILGIPLTVRRRVYEFLLCTKYADGPRNFQYAPRVEDGILRLRADAPVFPLSTAILLTNRQIHDEASSVLWSSNQSIRLPLYNDDLNAVVDLLQHSGMGFVSSNPGKLSSMTRHALDIAISETPHNRRKRCVLLFPALFLPRFVNFLRQICNALPMWGQNHQFELTLRNSYS